jgi:hypothetical protein
MWFAGGETIGGTMRPRLYWAAFALLWHWAQFPVVGAFAWIAVTDGMMP